MAQAASASEGWREANPTAGTAWGVGPNPKLLRVHGRCMDNVGNVAIYHEDRGGVVEREAVEIACWHEMC